MSELHTKMMKLQAMILFAAALSHPFAATASNIEQELVKMDEMVCERIADGSMICTFRATPPTSTAIPVTITHDCLNIPGSSLCLDADIHLSVKRAVSAIDILGRD